jgi:chitinase
MRLILALLLVAVLLSACGPNPAFESTLMPSTTLPRLIAYFPSWAPLTRGFQPSSIPIDRITHINYAFAVPNVHGDCVWDNAFTAEENLPALQQLRQAHPELRVLISIGGGGNLDKPFATVVESPQAISAFTARCVALMQKWGFDGLDLDWEFPKAEQKEAYTALLVEMRLQLKAGARSEGPAYLLTIAVPAGPWAMSRMDLARITPVLDWINLMTYDYYGSWSAVTGHNSPLFGSPEDPQGLSVETTVEAYLASGVPAGKLVVGVPFYGRGFQQASPQHAGLYQANNGAYGPGTYDYSEIAFKYLPTFERHWDAAARVPWLYDPEQQVLISYEDPESMQAKAAYVLQNNLGGVMIWQIAGDDAKHSLLNALVGK